MHPTSRSEEEEIFDVYGYESVRFVVHMWIKIAKLFKRIKSERFNVIQLVLELVNVLLL